jgi:hypothetical protein
VEDKRIMIGKTNRMLEPNDRISEIHSRSSWRW